MAASDIARLTRAWAGLAGLLLGCAWDCQTGTRRLVVCWEAQVAALAWGSQPLARLLACHEGRCSRSDAPGRSAPVPRHACRRCCLGWQRCTAARQPAGAWGCSAHWRGRYAVRAGPGGEQESPPTGCCYRGRGREPWGWPWPHERGAAPGVGSLAILGGKPATRGLRRTSTESQRRRIEPPASTFLGRFARYGAAARVAASINLGQARG